MEERKFELFPGFEIIYGPDVPEPDTSYFLPWTLDMIYAVEPSLKEIAAEALKAKQKGFYKRLDAYIKAKQEADKLLGWYSRDPRLRCSRAWDCFFDPILDELRL